MYEKLTQDKEIVHLLSISEKGGNGIKQIYGEFRCNNLKELRDLITNCKRELKKSKNNKNKKIIFIIDNIQVWFDNIKKEDNDELINFFNLFIDNENVLNILLISSQLNVDENIRRFRNTWDNRLNWIYLPKRPDEFITIIKRELKLDVEGQITKETHEIGQITKEIHEIVGQNFRMLGFLKDWRTTRTPKELLESIN